MMRPSQMRPVVRVLAYEQMAEAGWDQTDDPGLAGANANLAAFKLVGPLCGTDHATVSIVVGPLCGIDHGWCR